MHPAAVAAAWQRGRTHLASGGSFCGACTVVSLLRRYREYSLAVAAVKLPETIVRRGLGPRAYPASVAGGTVGQRGLLNREPSELESKHSRYIGRVRLRRSLTSIQLGFAQFTRSTWQVTSKRKPRWIRPPKW